MREGALAELFRADEEDQRPLKPQRDLRRAPQGMPSAWIVLNAIALALVGTVAVTALVLSVWQLRADSGGAHPTSAAVPAAGVPAATVAVTEPEQAPAEKTPLLVEEPKATLARLVLAAARGDCWLEVHVGSATGKLLFAGMLEQGRSLRFVKKRLWLAFGAGGNLEVTLNGQRVESFPTGTATAIVTAKGVSGPL